MKHLKTFLIAVMMIVMAISFAACGTTNNSPDTGDNSGIVIGGDDETQTPSGGDTTGSENESQTPSEPEIPEHPSEPETPVQPEQPETPNNPEVPEQPETPGSGNEDDEKQEIKILVAYFSATNTTEGIANYVAGMTGGDLYEITPAVPYTADDLKYYTGGRADQEQADPTSRPAISGSVENMDDYDIIYIGYPIWHGQAPKIIYTFLESYDFSEKTIVTFCTSASSGIGSSSTNLHSLASDATWVDGQRFSGSASQTTIDNWVISLNLPYDSRKDN